VTHPEGVIGKAKLADPKKAYKTIEAFLDYVVKLHNDILAKFPPGVLPPIEMMTKRDKAEMEAIIKGPGQKGGRHIYTLGFPP
jgi:creatinine amidohydrolase